MVPFLSCIHRVWVVVYITEIPPPSAFPPKRRTGKRFSVFGSILGARKTLASSTLAVFAIKRWLTIWSQRLPVLQFFETGSLLDNESEVQGF
jgi:hypothetical protein